MTFLTSHAPTELSAPSLSGRAQSFFAGLFAGFIEYRRIRRNTLELGSLSEATLKDIGIDRSEIQRIARLGR